MANSSRRKTKSNRRQGRSGRSSNAPVAQDRSPGASRRRGFDPAQPFQVGRRPSSPLLLLVTGLLWVAAGVIVLFAMHAGWRFLPAVVFVGIGLFFVRGSSATILRRERRRQG